MSDIINQIGKLITWTKNNKELCGVVIAALALPWYFFLLGLAGFFGSLYFVYRLYVHYRPQNKRFVYRRTSIIIGTAASCALGSAVVCFGLPVPSGLCDPAKIEKVLKSRLPVSSEPLYDPTVIKSYDQLIWAHNKRLEDRIREIGEMAQSSVTLVVGPPGSGKSTLLELIFKKYPNSKLIKLRPKIGPSQFSVLQLQDKEELGWIQMDGTPNYFGKMKAIKELSQDVVVRLLTDGAKKPLVLIDDLDEIHPDSATDFLGLLDSVLFKNKLCSCDVILVGRPEAFVRFLTKNTVNPKEIGQNWGSIIELESPAIDPLAIKLWVKSFITSSKAADTVKKAINVLGGEEKTVDVFVTKLLELDPGESWVAETLRIPFTSRVLCEYMVDQYNTDRNWKWNVTTTKERILEKLFTRASETHGRPIITSPSYYRLFDSIASKYADKIDEKTGFFPVGDQDGVPVFSPTGNKELGTIRVIDVLDRSGLAYIQPANWGNRRYSFSPLWIHSYFLRKRNADYFWGCEPLSDIFFACRRNWYLVSAIVILVGQVTVGIMGYKKRKRLYADGVE